MDLNSQIFNTVAYHEAHCVYTFSGKRQGKCMCVLDRMIYVAKESYVTALPALMPLGKHTPTPWTDIFTHTYPAACADLLLRMTQRFCSWQH